MAKLDSSTPASSFDSSTKASSFDLESEDEPSKSRPKLTRGKSASKSFKLHKDLPRLTKNSYLDKERYIMNWLWVFGALALMVIFGVGGWAFPDGSNPTCDPSDTAKNRTMCGMIEVVKAGMSNMTFLSGFIIAGFVSSAVKLWAMKRTAYCGESILHIDHCCAYSQQLSFLNCLIALCGATRNLLINVGTLVPQEERTLLARWSILGFELVELAKGISDGRKTV